MDKTDFNETEKKAVLRMRIRWIRKILASWLQIRKKYADPRIRIQKVENQPKTEEKKLIYS